MSKLSNREQIMLIILVFFLVIAGSFSYVVMPTLARLNEMRVELDGLKEEQLDTRMTIIEAETYATTHEATVKTIDDAKSKLYAPMRADQLEKLLTDLCLRHALTPVELVVPDALSAPAGTAEPKEGEPPSPITAPCYSVLVTAVGSYDSFLAMLDEMNKNPAISPVEYKYDSFSSEEPISMLLEVYVFDEASFSLQDVVVGAMAE